MGYNVPAEESQPKLWSHINGSTEEILARYCITEICQSWPVYRDASEWGNYRSIWTDDAVVFTTWSGGLQIDDFIEISKKGRRAGDFIMHRAIGALADVNLAKNRGIGKMKATITQRLTIQGIEVDVECDCRFIFFCKRIGTEWKAQWMKIFYERDKLVPVNGKDVPTFSNEELAKYTAGYKYLSACQATLGHKIMNDLPNASNEGFYKLYDAMAKWMEGEDVELRGWEKY